MPKYLDLRGPIAACTIYAGGELVARVVTVTLPAVSPTPGVVGGRGEGGAAVEVLRDV